MPQPSPVLQWSRPPLQERSRRTLEAILDAAERLLDEGTWADTSVKAIAERAGCSVGAFYGRFKGKEDLLRALYSRYRAESLQLLGSALKPDAWHGVPLASAIEAFCTFIVADYRTRRGLRRAFLQGALDDAAVREVLGQLTAETIDAMATLLQARSDEIAHPDPRVAADFCHRIAFGILEQDLVTAPLQPIATDVLTAELTRAIVGYLGVTA